MNRRPDDDPRPLPAVVLGGLAVAIAPRVADASPLLRRLIDHGLTTAIVAVSTLALVAALLLGARRLVCRRVAAGRVSMVVVPTDGFAPSVETVLRFASSLGRARHRFHGAFTAPASAVRVLLDTDPDGRLRYILTMPEHAAGALRTAVGSFGDDVEIRELDPTDDITADHPHAHVARAELVLARPSSEPLRSIGVDPDPLTGFAHALAGVDARAAVAVDLLPITAAGARRLRRRMIRDAHETTQRPIGFGELLGGGGRRVGRADAGELVQRRSTQRALTSKLGQPEPLFAVQVLLRAASPSAGASTRAVGGLLAAFDQFAGENRWRTHGLRGLLFRRVDALGRRGRFDRRWRTGHFRPARRRVVTATEIAGLLKPPTANCHASNVLRSGGAVPPPPPGLPTFAGQRALLPLGLVTRRGQTRMVGVPLSSTFFSYFVGRSRYGKTATAMNQFIHIARSGHGCFFLDPHEDALRKIKEHLTDEGLRDRVIEIDLASRSGRQPGWNLFAVDGRSPERALLQVDAVVDAFASALLWDERNTRALNLVTQAAQALTELARVVPPELAPTLFQVPTLLGNDEWRAAVLPHVSQPTRQFFADRFPRLPAGAITPVTNLIDRLRVAPSVAALLGSPTCTYDVRKAMDDGLIVLACPGTGSARDRLVANFLVYDLLHAAKTRAALPPEARRPFYVFLDEVQTYDGPNLPALLEQTAKYGVRAFLFNQDPERLTPATFNAVTTNRSHLQATALNAKAAAMIAREWGGAIEPEVLGRLSRFTYLASVTLDMDISAPFLVHGVPVEELHADACRPEQLGALEQAIDRNTGRRPVAGTFQALGEHDQKILNYLRQRRDDRGGRAPKSTPRGSGERTLGGPR
jgi:hypothetical protein